MNQIRQIQALNKRELEAGVSTSASWHADYRDTAYIYIGGLPYDLSEGDIVTIFSQYGEPVHINLVRDKETGKSKGFAFLKYEDQRSTDLAVDNLGGATILNRTLRVDHTRYKRKDDEEIYDNTTGIGEEENGVGEDKESDRSQRKNTPEEQRPLLPEEKELSELMRDHDDDDPMKEYLIQEKRDEVNRAIEKYEAQRQKEQNHKHRHRHSHKHHDHDRSRRKLEGGKEERDQEKRHRRERDGSASPNPRGSHSHERSNRHRHRDRSVSRDRSERHRRR